MLVASGTRAMSSVKFAGVNVDDACTTTATASDLTKGVPLRTKARCWKVRVCHVESMTESVLTAPSVTVAIPVVGMLA